MITDKITFKAQKNAPSPKEVDYWIDTASNPNGGEMKYYDGSKWSKVNGTDSSESNLEYEFVDLGLPSGLKWATCNLGATKPEEYGLYYAWGETGGRTIDDKEITWADYKFSIDGSSEEFSKYNLTDNKVVLDFIDDAAHHVNDSMRIPTSEEYKELIANVNKKWETINGIAGVRLTSKTNGNSIFIPEHTLWSSSRYPSQPAYAYDVEINAYQMIAQNYYKFRTKVCVIRPVQEPSVPFNPNKYYTKAEIDAKLDAVLEQINSAE